MGAPIWKEWYVLISLSAQHISTGFIHGFPAVLTPSLMSNNSDIHATREETSWITAAYPMTGSIGFFLLPTLLQLCGRRFVNVFWNILVIIGSVTIALGSNVTTLSIGRGIQGLTFGAKLITGIMSAEYVHPKRRGLSVAIKIFAVHIGITLCHCLSFLLTWRQISWLTIIPAILGILTTFTWPESPYWLAYKGRFEHSLAAFEWLRGTDSESNKEIKEVLSAQRELQKSQNRQNVIVKTLKAISSKEFLKPLLIAAALNIAMHSSGVHVMMAYIIEIMVQLTGDKSKAFTYILGFDFMKILAGFSTIFIVTLLPRRTLLFLSGFTSAFSLLLACLSNYLTSIEVLNISWMTPTILVLYNFVSNAGILTLSVVIEGEIFPLQYKGIGSCGAGIISSLAGMATMKLTSNMLSVLKLHGTFVIYVAIMLMSLSVLYFTLPETKDRTLQDIEKEFIDINLPKKDEHDDMKVALSEMLDNKS